MWVFLGVISLRLWFFLGGDLLTMVFVATFPEHFLPPEPVHVVFLLKKKKVEQWPKPWLVAVYRRFLIEPSWPPPYGPPLSRTYSWRMHWVKLSWFWVGLSWRGGGRRSRSNYTVKRNWVGKFFDIELISSLLTKNSLSILDTILNTIFSPLIRSCN